MSVDIPPRYATPECDALRQENKNFSPPQTPDPAPACPAEFPMQLRRAVIAHMHHGFSGRDGEGGAGDFDREAVVGAEEFLQIPPRNLSCCPEDA